MSSEIVPFRYSALDLNIQFEIDSNCNLNLTALRGIYNAWLEGAQLDDYGRVWISQSKLHTVLRTTKENANYIALKINEEDKIEIDGETYIKGSQIARILDEVIESAGSIKRGQYARYSEKTFKKVRDSASAEMIRAEYYEKVKDLKKNLKEKRIKKLKLETDELTNLLLDKSNSDFSHIRAAQVYLHLADRYWNGVVVNKNTHKIITDRAINDEEQLFDLCKELGWNTGWYDTFCKCLKSYS